MSKFTIDNQLLLSRLNEMRKIIPENSIKPIDEYVLFDYNGKGLTVTANGNNIEMTATLGVLTGDGEAFCTSVPADTLIKTLSLFDNKDTMFSYEWYQREEDKVEVATLIVESGEGSDYRLNCETKDNFPVMTCGKATSRLRADASFIKSAFTTAYTFIDQSENSGTLLPGLQGICMEAIKGGEYIQVTGASRVSGCRIQFYGEDVVDQWEKVLIPRLFGEIVLKTIVDSDTLTIEHDGRTMSVPGSMFNIKCVLMEATFPSMDAIFAQRDQCTSLVMDRENFAKALKRLKHYNDKGRELFMEIRSNEIYMRATSALTGNEGEERLFMETPMEMQIGMNIHGMINTLSRIEAHNVKFYYFQPSVAFFVVPDYGDDGGKPYSAQFIIMPCTFIGQAKTSSTKSKKK